MALCRFKTRLPGWATLHPYETEPKWGWTEPWWYWPLEDEAVTNVLTGQSTGGLPSLSPHTKTGQANEPIAVDPKLGPLIDELAPITTGMEVWAAGVTYESSKFARM